MAEITASIKEASSEDAKWIIVTENHAQFVSNVMLPFADRIVLTPCITEND